MSGRERLHIAVGVIYNQKKDKVLISKRSADVHQGGVWEFPGGKLELQESTEEALSRELFEELGLILEEASPLICFDYDYPSLEVKLDVWKVERWHGELSGREGQEIEWVVVSELKERKFPEANKLILSMLSQ